MLKIFFLSCFCLWMPLIQADVSIRQQVEDLLPDELVNLSSKTVRADLEKKLTTKVIKKKDSDALYLKYFEDKNDVTVGFKKNHFEYLYVELPSKLSQKKPNFYIDIIKQLSKSQKEKIAKENAESGGHEVGRFIIMDIPEEKLKLEFYNTDKKELRSIILYSKK